MYHYLTRAVKKRFIETLRYCFNANAQYESIVDHIREKYEFRERPQQGVVIQGASATPISLSSDNFLGTLESHVMLAHVDDFEGSFVEWVREDDRLLQTTVGFPTSPGVYYIQLEEVSSQDFQFYVDPLLSVMDETLITFVTGSETSAFLLNAPILGESLRIFTQGGYELISGTGLTLTASESLFIGGSDTHLALGLPEGQVSVSETSSNTGPFTFTSGVDDVFSLTINGKTATVTFTSGTALTTDEVITELRAAFDAANIGRSESPLTNDGGNLTIGGSKSLEFLDDTTSPANTVLGFTAGFVAPTVTGLLAQPTVPSGSTFRVVVDDTVVEVTLTEAKQQSVTDIAAEISAGTSATSLVVTTQDAGDFSVDETTGEVTFLHEFEPNTTLYADYRYAQPSLGPFSIGNGNCSNNDAIPGVVLAFGNSLKDGDVVALVITEGYEEVADVYGGKVDISLEIDIIARDAMSRSEIADLITMYLFQWRRERLAEEGLAIESVSMGGESEEPYNEVGDNYYYLANVSVSLKADWELYIEKPLLIRRVTLSSFEQEARVASGAVQGETADQLEVRLLSTLPNLLLNSPVGFERIR